MNTPAEQHRAITPDTKFKADLRTIFSVLGVIIAGTVAAVLMYTDMKNSIKELSDKVDTYQKSNDERIDAVQDSVYMRFNFLIKTLRLFNPFDKGSSNAQDVTTLPSRDGRASP